MTEYTIQSEAEMQQLGERIGGRLHGGDVIELIGDVGAGKTALTKGIGRGLGVKEVVQSPSFTLSRVYDAANDRRLAHYDFYRLSDAGILSDELSDTMTQPDVITVIEWADIVEGVLPVERTRIRIVALSEYSRLVTIDGGMK